MNFSYITALFNWKRSSAPKSKSCALGLKLLITFIGIVATAIFLMKIYEVPVNHTEISVRYNTDSIDVSVKIVRDFDLHDHISKDTTHPEGKYEDHTGNILIEGFAYSKKNDSLVHRTRGNMSTSMDIQLRNELSAQLQKKKVNHFIDSVHHLVYTKISGTKRQLFKIFTSATSPVFLYNELCYFTNGEDTVIQHWRSDYHSIHTHTPHNIFVEENLTTSGITDDSIKIKDSYMATSLDKPNLFITAEDFSKLVEEIRFDSIDAKEVHRLDINYKGAAEFGFLRPAPDSMTISSIHYSTLDKINQIAIDGLKYQVRFPELENMQEIRIFFATMLLAGLLGIFFNLFYRLLRPWGLKVWKKRSKNIISLTILISVILVGIIVYFVYISRPASYLLDNSDIKPFTEIEE